MDDKGSVWYPTEDHQCAVVEEEATSEWFELTTGVKGMYNVWLSQSSCSL